MATRKIIDAKHNGEKVWLKGHAQATYLSNGSTVEDALNSIQSGGITAETDPIFLASPAASITEAKKTEWDNKMDKVVLSPVATSGNYNDLTNKPTIPASVTESTVSGWGFTKNTGTITGISANGTSVATSGVANIPAATTSKYGVTKLSSATNSTSTTLAATASAVKSAYDLANSKQEKLTSGTNIKTVNGESILGSGDLVIGGGNVQAVDTGDVIDDVTVDYATKTYVDGLVGDINSILESIINGGVTLITFTIDGTEYQAENGMTWEQWVNSEYNTKGFTIDGEKIHLDLNSYIAGVISSEVIIPNYAYVVGTSGNGGGAN